MFFYNYSKNYSIKYGNNAFPVFNNFPDYLNPVSTNVEHSVVDAIFSKYSTENLYLIGHLVTSDEYLLTSFATKTNAKAAFNGHTHAHGVAEAFGVDCYFIGTFSTLDDGKWYFRNLEISEAEIKTSVIAVSYSGASRAEEDVTVL